MTDQSRGGVSRRQFLGSTAIILFLGLAPRARAVTLADKLPWKPFAELPPEPFDTSRWYFFTPDEARTVEAVVDRLIPADDLSVGGKEAGCASFIDRQLAGTYGASSRLYTKGPFMPGLPTQGYQGAATPAGQYQAGITALNGFARGNFGGRDFSALSAEEQDKLLTDLEAGRIKFPTAPGFFNLILQNTMEGFFADPVYGGNRDMVGWKMIGFPGARYDYRDYIARHNEPFPLGPVAIASGRPEWKASR